MIPAISVLIASDDSHLSRLDPSLLSQQAQMEMFVDAMQNKDRFMHNENYKDLSEWHGITCNDAGEVVEIHIDYDEEPQEALLGGRMNMKFLPQTVQLILLDGQAIRGTLEANALPDIIKSFSVVRNEIEGPLVMSDFPRGIQIVDVGENKLQGEINWAAMPPNLEIFSVPGNKLCGGILLSNLPPSLTLLGLGVNQFSGEISLLSLPPNLTHLDVSNNDLYGSLIFDAIPARMEAFELSGNRFTGTVHFSQIIENQLRFHVDDNQLVGSLGGFTRFLPNAHFLRTQKNKLSGELSLDTIPETEDEIWLNNNDRRDRH